jgi:hypothetical protein
LAKASFATHHTTPVLARGCALLSIGDWKSKLVEENAKQLKTYPKTSDAWIVALKNGVFEQAQPVFG